MRSQLSRNATFAREKERASAAPMYTGRLSSYLDLPVSAVNIEFDARDVGRILRCQERDGAGYFLGLSEAFHRNPREHVLREFIEAFLGQSRLVEDRRNDRPRRNRVHADASPDQFRRCGS